MARIRSIKPEFFTDAKLAKLEPLERLFFIGLWVWADREGKMQDEPLELRARILPYDTLDADQVLSKMQKMGLLTRYSVRKERFLVITNFIRHQRPHYKEPESRLPNVPDLHRKRWVTKSIMDSNSIHDQSIITLGREGKGREGEESSLRSDSPPKPSEASADNGNGHPKLDPELKEVIGRTSHLRDLAQASCVSWWGKLLPVYEPVAELYVFDEIAKADLWLEENPKRRPASTRGLQRFMRHWFDVAESRARRTAAQLAATGRRYATQAH